MIPINLQNELLWHMFLCPPTPPKDKRYYLSGPMTGLPNDNRDAFHAVWNELRTQGYFAINPANIEQREDWGWSDYMREAIRWLMGCDAIVMLVGWKNSKGAKIERELARALGMPVYYWDGQRMREDDPFDDADSPF